ncbi:hypothetical protein OAB57_00985 [Bacteriovoracaceae bacterium]|nr:hypothetical protein [Bacteriovoracaceae bacterium]
MIFVLTIRTGVCNPTNLSLDNIEALKHAYIGIDGYRIDVLHSKEQDQTIVILGELHAKNKKRKIEGTKIVNTFQHIGIEGIFSTEWTQLKSNYWDWPLLTPVLLAINIHALFNRCSSTLEDTYNRTVSIPVHNGSKTLFSNKTWPEFAYSLEGDLSQVYEDNDLPFQHKIDDFFHFKQYTYLLESGVTEKVIVSAANINYLIFKRNQRMISNLINILNEVKIIRSFLVIVGKSHSKGLKKKLNKEGFTNIKFSEL